MPPPILSRLPLGLSRFLGYRPTPSPPFAPLPFPPFSLLPRVPLVLETYFFGFTGAFISIVLIEIAMSYTHSAFDYEYHSPIIIASFGASAVLTFGALEAPLAQPRALVGGHFVSALIGVCLQRLFGLIDSYQGWVDQTNSGAWHPVVVINGALSMALALFAMQVLNVVHPPAGATALIAATSPFALRLSWRYLPVVLTSSLIMLGWGLLNNNLGRRRWPVFWWAAGGRSLPPLGSAEKRQADEEKRKAEEEREARRVKEMEEGRGERDASAGSQARAGPDPEQPKGDRGAQENGHGQAGGPLDKAEQGVKNLPLPDPVLGLGRGKDPDAGLGETGFQKPA